MHVDSSPIEVQRADVLNEFLQMRTEMVPGWRFQAHSNSLVNAESHSCSSRCWSIIRYQTFQVLCCVMCACGHFNCLSLSICKHPRSTLQVGPGPRQRSRGHRRKKDSEKTFLRAPPQFLGTRSASERKTSRPHISDKLMTADVAWRVTSPPKAHKTRVRKWRSTSELGAARKLGANRQDRNGTGRCHTPEPAGCQGVEPSRGVRRSGGRVPIHETKERNLNQHRSVDATADADVEMHEGSLEPEGSE